MFRRQLILTVLLAAVALSLPSAIHSNTLPTQVATSYQTTQLVTNVTSYCTSRNASTTLPCSQISNPQRTLVGSVITQFFYYNNTVGHLNSIHEVHAWPGIMNNRTSPSSIPLPTNEIYRTTHWIWFADPTIYNQNKQYIDPLLDWPETSYGQISQWLGLTLGPGSFDGGRRAIYVDSNPGYFGWAAGGNQGIGYQVFKDIPDWPWVVIPHEMTNVFTGSGAVPNGGWPSDWWADGRSPFPAMVAVNVEKAHGVSYWQQHDTADSNDPAYVMFRDKLQGAYGWSLFQNAFAAMQRDGLRLDTLDYTRHSEYEASNWLQLHYLKSHVVAYYLSRAAGLDLSSILNQGTVGQKPTGWTSTFNSYQINLNSVLPSAQIQTPSGVQSGIITLTASASDPDWGVKDVTFWYSTDNSVFWYVGTDTNGADGWSMSWDTRYSIIGQKQVWVMAVSHDLSGLESPWSVSSPFTINNPACGNFPSLSYPTNSWSRVWCTYTGDPNNPWGSLLSGNDNPSHPNFDENWGTGTVDGTGLADNMAFSSGMTYYLISGTTYTASLSSDDGSRLFVGGVLQNDCSSWQDQGYTTRQCSILGDGAVHQFRLDYFEHAVNAHVSFQLSMQVTIASSPSGSGFVSVDGVPIITSTSFNWVIGSTHLLAANSQQSCGSGCRNAFGSWDDSGAQSHTITASSTSSYTASFQTQYYLTVNSPHDSASPTSGWYNSGATIGASVTSPTSGGAGIQYVCTGSTGTGSAPTGASCSVSFAINAPSTLTWNWKTQNYLTVNSAYGSPNPSSGWFDAGSPIVISVPSPVSGGTGVQYVCIGWTGSGGAPSSGSSCSVSFSLNIPSTITWNWKTQYYLATETSPLGLSVSPSSGWLDAGKTGTIVGNPNKGYGFASWNGTGSGSYAGLSQSATVTMNSPITETANYNHLMGIPLNAGWNLVSLPLVPRDSAITSVLSWQITANNVVSVWSYTSTGWQSFVPGKGGGVKTMTDGKGYWVNMKTSDTLYVDGSVIAPASAPPTYSLVQGWNLVGFKPQPNATETETVGAYLSSISGSYDTNNVWVYDNPSRNWIRAGSGYMLQPGQAMWILMTAPATLKP